LPADPEPSRRPSLLIIGLSGRALATAAQSSGFDPVVVDFFLDQDTRRASRLGFRMGGHWRVGFRRSTLVPLVDVLARTAQPIGIVYGAGFEDRPGILAALAARHRLIGNAAATVRLVKRPRSLVALCRELGIAHPEIATTPPQSGAWLRKRAGGASGVHVGAAAGVGGRGWYWQRRVSGRPVSALFLADGASARVLGLSEQWADPCPEAPFRYGGAVRPAPPGLPEAALRDAVVRLAAAAALRGLNSADFLVTPDAFHLIEINPRPGASLDVFAHPALLRLHLEACEGHLPASIPEYAGAAAARIVYAPAAIHMPPGFVWPEWAADRGSTRDLAAGDPVCTVHASATTPEAARALAEQRANEILQRMKADRCGT
jgi:predicted ATP-grasp superfamily ATP-dependent carboligase